MHVLRISVLIAPLLLAGASGTAVAQSDHAEAAAGATDLSSLTHTAVVNASPAEVWDAFTNPEKMRQWWAPKLQADIRVGGIVRSSYNPNSTLNDGFTIENTILSLAPNRMVSMRCTRTPDDFPFKVAMENMWTVMLIDQLSPDRSRITISGFGFADDEESRKLRAFFDQGNQYVLETLCTLLDPDRAETDADSNRVLELLGRLTNGEWIAENTMPDGGVFRVLNRASFGPDGHSLVQSGWLGDASGMSPHASCLVYRLPVNHGGGIEFTCIHETGALARGQVTLHDENTVEWHWPENTLDGRVGRYDILMSFADDSHYTMIMREQQPDGSCSERMRLPFTRVDHAPDAFHAPKPLEANHAHVPD